MVVSRRFAAAVAAFGSLLAVVGSPGGLWVSMAILLLVSQVSIGLVREVDTPNGGSLADLNGGKSVIGFLPAAFVPAVVTAVLLSMMSNVVGVANWTWGNTLLWSALAISWLAVAVGRGGRVALWSEMVSPSEFFSPGLRLVLESYLCGHLSSGVDLLPAERISPVTRF